MTDFLWSVAVPLAAWYFLGTPAWAAVLMFLMLRMLTILANVGNMVVALFMQSLPEDDSDPDNVVPLVRDHDDREAS